jgi:hypothetical protein
MGAYVNNTAPRNAGPHLGVLETHDLRISVIEDNAQLNNNNTNNNLLYFSLRLNILFDIEIYSVVDIATSYGLDDRGVGVRGPVGSRIFSSPNRPDRL